MNHLDLKQKMIIGIILIIIVGFLCYYVYAKEDNNTQLENNLEIESKETMEENEKDESILVHVSGAVNQEGVVKLKVDSRVADAIEKARRNNRKCSYGRN